MAEFDGAWDISVVEIARSLELAAELYGPVRWDVGGFDFACWRDGISVEACGQRYLDDLAARPHANGIILIHDRPAFNVGSDGPARLVEWLIPRLLEASYGFVALDELAIPEPEERPGGPPLRSTLAPDGR